MAESSRGKSIAVWVLSVLLALLFAASAFPKLTGDPQAVAGFTQFGYAQWFRVLIGILEALGGVLLLIPALARAGTAVLGVIMIGATYSHLAIADYGHAPIPAVIFILLAGIFVARG